MTWDDLSPSCGIFFGKCPPPCLIQIPWVTSFPGKWTDRAVPKDSGCKGLPVQAAFGWLCFCQFLSLAPRLTSNQKASPGIWRRDLLLLPDLTREAG